MTQFPFFELVYGKVHVFRFTLAPVDGLFGLVVCRSEVHSPGNSTDCPVHPVRHGKVAARYRSVDALRLRNSCPTEQEVFLGRAGRALQGGAGAGQLQPALARNRDQAAAQFAAGHRHIRKSLPGCQGFQNLAQLLDSFSIS
jgi:hypothetical protein